MLILADAVLEAPAKLHRPGRLRIKGETILEVGSHLQATPGEEVLDFSGLTITPGFINLHAHLDLSSLHGSLIPGKTFADWLRQIIPILPGLTPEVRRHSIIHSSRKASHSGTTSVLSITSDLSTLAGLNSTSTRVWWALEFMDLHGNPSPSQNLDRATAWLSRHPATSWHLALSPHAPYTSSPTLYQELGRLASEHHLPFTTHLGESKEETDLLFGNTGPLHPLLPPELKREDFCGNTSSVDWCRRHHSLPSHPILAHLNELKNSDVDYLAEIQATIVHCPSTHQWFNRPSFPLNLLRAKQIPVCLGTDSPACSPNLHLDLREEVRLFRQNNPKITHHEVWEMITSSPARALRIENKLGTLQTGSWADWAGWRIPPDQDPIESILESHGPAEASCVAGRVNRHDFI